MARIVFITGGAKGIGAEMVREFAISGYSVAFCYKTSKAKAENLIAELKQEGFHSVFGYCCDVSDYNAVISLKKQINREVGLVDTIICNAGVCHRKLFCDETESDFESVISNNFKSMFNVCRIFSPDMITEKFGRIINIGSIFGEIGGSMEALYSASKAAVVGFSRALSKELALSGITVNTISPGLINTEMNSNLSENDIDSLVDEIPVGRIGTTKDVANAAVFLAKTESSFITGQVISVNGGVN